MEKLNYIKKRKNLDLRLFTPWLWFDFFFLRLENKRERPLLNFFHRENRKKKTFIWLFAPWNHETRKTLIQLSPTWKTKRERPWFDSLLLENRKRKKKTLIWLFPHKKKETKTKKDKRKKIVDKERKFANRKDWKGEVKK